MRTFWLISLYNAIHQRVSGGGEIQSILGNISWQLLDKVIRLGAGFVILTCIARHLGPSDYGSFNYILAFSSVFSTFASLGLDSIVIRELVRQEESRNEILGTAFVIKIIGAVTILPMAILAIYVLRPGSPELHLYVALVTASSVFLAFDVVDYWFQAKVQSKHVVTARGVAFVICASLRVLLITMHAPLVAFVVISAFELVSMGVMLAMVYHLKVGSLIAWRYSAAHARDLIRDSWPLMLSAVMIMTYMKIDQIMIGEMLSNQEVGLYAAAVRIVEIWYVLPMILATTIFPMLFRTRMTDVHNYFIQIQYFFDVIVLIALGLATTLTLFAGPLLNIFFGSQFASASTVLQIYAWCLLFLFLLVGTGQHLIAENQTRFALFRNIVGAVINISLNLILIPSHGTEGAALASLVALFASGYLVNIFTPRMRRIFVMQTKSLLFPMAMLRIYDKIKLPR